MKLTPCVAGICGLFCGTCPSFAEGKCSGCLSDHVAPHCVACVNGFRTCAAEQGVTRCFECAQFPCERLEAFSKIHIVNGICHHTHVIDDLNAMRQIGVQAWVDKQTQAHTCPECGRLILWHERECPCRAPSNVGQHETGL